MNLCLIILSEYYPFTMEIVLKQDNYDLSIVYPSLWRWELWVTIDRKTDGLILLTRNLGTFMFTPWHDMTYNFVVFLLH